MVVASGSEKRDFGVSAGRRKRGSASELFSEPSRATSGELTKDLSNPVLPGVFFAYIKGSYVVHTSLYLSFASS